MNPSLEAINYITNCCPRMGAFSGPIEDINRFLERVASVIKDSKETEIFPGRYKEHVVYAINMITSSEFTSSKSAIASVYLNTRFEFYFRILSGKLTEDGIWISKEEYDKARTLVKGIPSNIDRGVSSVALAYKIMKTNQSVSASKICDGIDKTLYPNPVKMTDNFSITDIGDRIIYLRNPSAHGRLGDISSEAIFYGLLTAIIFYNQC